VEDFIRQLQERLAEHAPRPLDLPGVPLRESSVLLPLRLHGSEPHLIFTVRPQSLRNHAGQISFPGGARDAADETPQHVALREAEEELGIPRHQVRVLGQLDEVATPAFRVVPFVGLVPADLPLDPSPDEVAQVFEAPLRALLAPGVHRTELRSYGGRSWEIDFYPYGPHTIWGATGRILRNFLLRSGELLHLP
jgi:8-oxo-dGTP pyrophosphatase MutT (NUDIX family)